MKASKKEAGDLLACFSRPCRRVAHFRVVLAQFGLAVSKGISGSVLMTSTSALARVDSVGNKPHAGVASR